MITYILIKYQMQGQRHGESGLRDNNDVHNPKYKDYI